MDEVQPTATEGGMDDDEEEDPYGFLVEQCIIPSAEEIHLRSMPLFTPPTPTQQQPSPPPVVVSTVKHEQTDEIDSMPLEMEEKEEATTNMEVDEPQSVTKEPTVSDENSPPPPPNVNEAFSRQSPRDEPAAAAADDDDDDETPSLVTGEELQKTTEEEPHHASLPKLPEQNEGLARSQSPPTIQTGQTHFVPPASAAAVGVGPSSSSSSNPRNPKGGGGGEDNNTTIDILDVLRSKGFYVPRPRWWRPEGYDKD